jgi:hypothetical protein
MRTESGGIWPHWSEPVINTGVYLFYQAQFCFDQMKKSNGLLLGII